MKLRFLGGVTEVGSLSMVMENMGSRFLFDYGFTPSDPPELPEEAPPSDMAFLSHAHIDHAGMIPSLCAKTSSSVVATSLTLEVAEMLWRDSYKINRLEGYPQLFTLDDVRHTRNFFDLISFEDRRNFRGLSFNFHSAGHIPGSMMVEVVGNRRTLFTGDMNTIDTQLLKGAQPVDCDNLIMEATYADREHEPRKTQERKFVEKIREVVDRGGLAVVPAFAVGRTQEIMMILRGQGFDVWVDGMGKAVTQIFLRHSAYLRGDCKLKEAVREAKYISNPGDRSKALKGEVIVTTSGMMDGGPVLQYVMNIKNDPKSAILLTGYQVEGTNGRQLTEEGTLDVAGATRKMNCEVEMYDFSAHAGHSELAKFVRACDPENVVLFHSEDREALAEDLGDDYNFVLPETGDEVEL